MFRKAFGAVMGAFLAVVVLWFGFFAVMAVIGLTVHLLKGG